MDKSAILDALHELGFQTREIEDFGYVFDYEGIHFLYNPEEEDEEFFRISAPYLYEVEDEENRIVTLDIVNEVNCRLKYSKTFLQDDSVWASFETRVFDGVDAEELVKFSILLVRATVDLFFSKINGKDDPFADNSEQETNETNSNED